MAESRHVSDSPRRRACETGQTDEALATLEEAEQTIVRTGERYYEAELYRLKGRLLLKRVESRRSAMPRHVLLKPSAPPEKSLKSLELRASTALRGCGTTGQANHAEQMLSEIYGWFTEGVTRPTCRTRRPCWTNSEPALADVLGNTTVRAPRESDSCSAGGVASKQ